MNISQLFSACPSASSQTLGTLHPLVGTKCNYGLFASTAIAFYWPQVPRLSILFAVTIVTYESFFISSSKSINVKDHHPFQALQI